MFLQTDERGFTLVEVLVALVAAGLIAAAVMPAVYYATLRERRAADRLDALQAAQAQIQILLAAPIVQSGRVAGQTGQWRWNATINLESPANGAPSHVRMARIALDLRVGTKDTGVVRLSARCLVQLELQ